MLETLILSHKKMNNVEKIVDCMVSIEKETILVLASRMVSFCFIYAFGFSRFERGIRAKTTKPPAMRVVSKKCYTK